MSDLHGKIHWTELMTATPDASMAYYKSICGWSFNEMEIEGGRYWIAMRGDEMVGGIWDTSGIPDFADKGSQWTTYLAVSDVDAAAKATTEAGGQMIGPMMDMPGIGRIAMVIDPNGAPLGLMTPSPE